MKAIKSHKDIVGTWKGPFAPDNGPNVMTTVIIKEDGRFSIENSGFSRKGRLRISDGKAAIGRVGKMTLHEGDEVRILVLHGRSGRGQYTLVR